MVEVVVPAGMKPWAGGDSAPADWDAMAPVKWAVPKSYAETGVKQDEQPWRHGSAGWYDIIAYTPRADAKVSERDTDIQKLIARLGVEHCYLAPSDVAKARAILATLRAGGAREAEAAEHLANVLFADPGPKELAARQAAQEWWYAHDAKLFHATEYAASLARDLALFSRLWFERSAGFRIKLQHSRDFAREVLSWLNIRSKTYGS